MTTAIPIAPSNDWRGNDGQWSTFIVQIGTGDDAQVCQVLPATSALATWVVALEGCWNQPFSNTTCASGRGGLFNESSPAWKKSSKYAAVPFTTEDPLGGNYTETLSNLAYYGTAQVDFGWSGSGAPSLDNQLVYAYAAKTPYIGQLGLSPRSTNLSLSLADQYKSPLGTLAAQNTTSAYWAYTAGAYYHDPQSFGSLTFGGYDEGRGNVHEVLTAPIMAGTSRDLLVALTGISISGGANSPNVVDTPVYAAIDSLLPELWLPRAICTQFEDVLGLVWNDVYSMYLVDEDQHNQLLSLNPTFSFSLGLSITDSPSNGTNITLPYAAFDLVATFPLAGIQTATGSSRYFPLKRATSEDQIFLGRTFLQEAYVTADYDRNQLTVSPVTNSGQSIKTVHPPGTKSSHPLSAGAIAGIAVAAFVVVGFTCFLLWWFVGRPWYKRRQSAKFREKMEIAHEDLRGFYGTKKHEEEEAARKEQELDASTTAQGSERAEMPSPPPPASPRSMDSGTFSPVSEIHGSPIARRTFSGRSPVELPASHYFESRGESIEEEQNVNGRAEMP